MAEGRHRGALCFADGTDATWMDQEKEIVVQALERFIHITTSRLFGRSSSESSGGAHANTRNTMDPYCEDLPSQNWGPV